MPIATNIEAVLTRETYMELPLGLASHRRTPQPCAGLHDQVVRIALLSESETGSCSVLHSPTVRAKYIWGYPYYRMRPFPAGKAPAYPTDRGQIKSARWTTLCPIFRS